jgi:hypothetical protein
MMLERTEAALNVGHMVLHIYNRAAKEWTALERQASMASFLDSGRSLACPGNDQQSLSVVEFRARKAYQAERTWEAFGKFFAGLQLNDSSSRAGLQEDFTIVLGGFLAFIFTVISMSVVVMLQPGVTAVGFAWGSYGLFICMWIIQFMGTKTNELYFDVMCGIAVYFALLLLVPATIMGNAEADESGANLGAHAGGYLFIFILWLTGWGFIWLMLYGGDDKAVAKVQMKTTGKTDYFTRVEFSVAVNSGLAYDTISKIKQVFSEGGKTVASYRTVGPVNLAGEELADHVDNVVEIVSSQFDNKVDAILTLDVDWNTIKREKNEDDFADDLNQQLVGAGAPMAVTITKVTRKVQDQEWTSLELMEKLPPGFTMKLKIFTVAYEGYQFR